MKISQEYPSKYLRAEDLQGREVRVKISHVDREKMSQNADDFKPVVYFQNATKGVALNKTNSYVIASAYGDDTEDWRGQEIILFSIMTEFGGSPKLGIRVRIPTARDNKPAVKKPDPISSGPMPSDEIPF